MTKTVKIYLSGSIKKSGHYGESDYWNDEDKAAICHNLAPFEVIFLDPNIRTQNLSDPFATFGRDLFQVFASDFVFVDARNKRGLGVGAEMAFAKMRSIPVITLAPPNSHYVRNDCIILDQTLETWMHPFVSSLSDFVAPSIDDACRWIQTELLTDKAYLRGPECYDEAIAHYVNTQLEGEKEMHELVQSDKALQAKLEPLCDMACKK